LVLSLENKIEPSFNNLLKMPWSTWETVDDQSEYVNGLCATITQTATSFGSWLNEQHFKFFCDSFIESFVPKLIQVIYKCKRISEVGAEQLLLDMTQVKTVLLSLQSIPSSSASGENIQPQSKTELATSRYTKYTKKEMLHVEQLLKVLITPQVGLVHSFKNLLADSSEANFTRIMDLKGIKKSDQGILIEALRIYELNLKKEQGQKGNANKK